MSEPVGRDLGIDNDTLWSTVVADIPALLHTLRTVNCAAV